MSRDEIISVIIPTYNSAELLPEAIESVFQQTVPPQEIVVIDDGSDDDTEHVVNKFEEKVRYIYQEHAGVAVARNRGLEAATGDLITFIDADDIWCNQKIELQVELLQKHPNTGLVIGFLQRVCKSDDGSLVKVFEGDESGIFVMQLGSTLIRKEVFESVGNFDEKLKMSEDLDWFLRARESYVNVFVHDDVVQLYRQHDKNTTKDTIATKRYMLKAFKKSLDRRRESVIHSSIGLPSFNNMDEIVKFWKTNNKTTK